MRLNTLSIISMRWLCLTLCGCLVTFSAEALRGQSTDAPAVWNKPSEEVDQQVSAWAAQQFADSGKASAISEEARFAEDNPIRSSAPRQPAPLPPPSREIKPVRYEQGSAKDNPLRSASQSGAMDNSAAKQAFSQTQSTSVPAQQRMSSQNPFAQLDSQQKAAPTQSPEPRAFAPLPANEDVQSNDAASVFSSKAPPALEELKPVRQTAPGVDSRGERSIVASRSSVTQPITSVRSNALEPNRDLRPTQPAFQGSQAANGTGRPGGRELEGAQRASLVLEKRGPAEARVGQPCRFVLSVRNTGQRAAENVVLRDETPSGARLVESIPPAQLQGSQLSWRLGSLAPGEERSVEMHVEPLSEGDIGSIATVSFDAQASAVTRCTRPEIAVRLSAPGKVLVGQKQPLRIEVHNPGTGVATGVMLIEDVPSNMRHEAGSELEFEVGSLAPGETRQLDLMLSAESAGHVVNQLTAVADGGLRVEQSIEFDVVAPSLAVAVDGPGRRYLERPASYTVSIGNPGTAPAKDVRLVTKLPRGMKFVRANNLGEYDAETHSVYWSLAELPEGERGAVELVALPVTAGEHTLVVEGAAKNGLKAAESQSVRVEGVASLAFDVRDLQDPIEVGGQAAYDVVVTNEGTQAAENVRVVVQAPGGMRIVEARGQTQHRIGQSQVEFAPITRLDPGVKARFAVRMVGEQAGDQRITVSVQSDELSQPIRREESTRVFGDE